MTVQHSAITDPNLHEPKGVAAAAVDQVYVADGAGSGAWGKLTPSSLSGLSTDGANGQKVSVDGAGNFVLSYNSHGSVEFVNTTTPYVLAATTSFAKAAPTTTASGHPIQVTEATTARLTYTGIETEHFDVVCGLSLDQATGSNKDVSIAIAKNGTAIALSEQITTTVSGQKQSIGVHADVSLATNDYVEVFIKISAAANVNVYCYSLQAIAIGLVT